MLKRSRLFIWVIISFYPRAHSQPFVRIDAQPHEAPRIIEAHLHDDGVRVEFVDGDQEDLWLAMLCTGNKDKPVVCYQSSTTLVYPHMKNRLSYIKKSLSEVWWIEIRDLFGATARQKLGEDFSLLKVLQFKNWQKEGKLHLSFHLDDRAIPLNIWVKSSHKKILYQGSFVTSGTKNVVVNSGANKNLTLFYSGVLADGQMELNPQ